MGVQMWVQGAIICDDPDHEGDRAGGLDFHGDASRTAWGMRALIIDAALTRGWNISSKGRATCPTCVARRSTTTQAGRA